MVKRRNENDDNKELLSESESDGTIIINDSKHSENDDEYEPTTTDLEISVVSTPTKHRTINNQTTITNTLQLKK